MPWVRESTPPVLARRSGSGSPPLVAGEPLLNGRWSQKSRQYLCRQAPRWTSVQALACPPWPPTGAWMPTVTGRSVLVAGGAGAVGHFAIELARHGGARVATTVSSAKRPSWRPLPERTSLSTTTRTMPESSSVASAQTMDRIVEVNLAANLELDVGLAGPATTIVTFAAAAVDPLLPVRACMTANLTIRFVLLYGVPRQELVKAANDINEAIVAGALSGLPVHHFSLDDIIAAAHEAVEAGVVGKVLVDIG